MAQNQIVSYLFFSFQNPGVLSGNAIRRTDVIIVEEGNELTSRLRKQTVASLGNASIAGLANQPDGPAGLTPVPDEPLHDRGGIVAGCIIHHQNFKCWPVLH
jgi:hypothetical protein